VSPRDYLVCGGCFHPLQFRAHFDQQVALPVYLCALALRVLLDFVIRGGAGGTLLQCGPFGQQLL